MAAPNAESPVNPYATPRAAVTDVSGVRPAGEGFFAVTPLKLGVMTLTTFNLYLLYWFYKNWKAVQRIRNEDVNAPIRAFFYVLVSYSLFKRIREEAAKIEGVPLFPAGALATVVLVLGMLWRLPDPWWLVSFLSFAALIPVQNTVNAMNARVAPDADRNSRFVGWNWLALTLGTLLFILAMIGVFVEPA